MATNNKAFKVKNGLDISGTITTTNGAGTSGQFLKSTGTGVTWDNPSGSGTVTSVVAGTYLTGGTITSTGTIAVDATSTNTASKVVARDASGNFSAGTITGTLSGNASTATTATTANSVANALTISSPLTGSSYNGSSAVSIGIPAATSSVSGYLTSTDWTTFNNKGSGTVTSVSVSTANGVSGTVATATTTPAITLTLGNITPTSVASTGAVSGTSGNFTATSSIVTSSWEKWTLETTGSTVKARQGSDGNGLNFTTNARWTGSAWAEDSTTVKKFAYIQHAGNGRHEFRTSPTGAGVTWTTSLTVDDTGITANVPTAGTSATFTGNTYLATSSGNVGIGVTSVSSSQSGSATVLGICDPTTTNLASVRLSSAGSFSTGNRLELFAGSNLSGLYGQSNVPLAFSTNATERMRIDSSGNLLINTTSATDKITLNGGNLGVIVSGGGASQSINFRNAGNTLIQQIEYSDADGSLNIGGTGGGGYPLKFSTGGTERMRVEAGGNVVIGSATAYNKFEISGSSARMALNNGGGASRKSIVIEPLGYNGNSYARIESYDYGTATGGTLVLNSVGGAVSIGTNSPSALRTTIESDNTQLRIRNSTTRYRSDYTVSNTGRTNINSYDDTGSVYKELRLDGSPITFAISGSDKISIDSAGSMTFGNYLKIANDNTAWGTGNYFRGTNTHFVLGVQNGNVCYINYGNSSGELRFYGNIIRNDSFTVLDTSMKYANFGTSKGWTAGSSNPTGYFGGNFSLNGTTSENTLAWGDTPYGGRGLLWSTTNNDATSDADGGWNKEISGCSDTKTYRSIVWVRRNSASSNGTFYHGCNSGGSTLNLDGTANGNPYFWNGGIGNFVQGRWYLSVGYVHAYADGSTSSYGGLYDSVTGAKVINYTDFKMASGATGQTQRVYLYYSTDSNALLDFWGPRFEEVTGDEPSINSMLLSVSTVVNSSNYSSYALPISGGTVSASNGQVMTVTKSGSAPGNNSTLLVQNTYGDHSWGITGEFRVNSTGGTDRPSILFSSGYNSDTWSVGFGGAGDSIFRINQDHGYRNNGWGTTRFSLDRSGNAYFSGNLAIHAGNYSSYAVPLTGGTMSGVLRVNHRLEAGQNTNGTAVIDAYGGSAYFGCNSSSNGLRVDASGYTYVSYLNQGSGNSENPTVDQVIVTNGSDNYFRKASLAHFKAKAGMYTNGGSSTSNAITISSSTPSSGSGSNGDIWLKY